MFRRDKISTPLAACLLLALTLSRHAQAQFTLSEAKEIAAIPLSVEKVQKMYRVAGALRPAAPPSTLYQTLEEQIQAVERVPNAENLCRAEGLSVREFVLIGMALGIAENPINNPAYQTSPGQKTSDPMVVADSPEHIKFVQDHHAEILKAMSVLDHSAKDRRK